MIKKLIAIMEEKTMSEYWKTDTEACPYAGKYAPMIVMSRCPGCPRNGFCKLSLEEMKLAYNKHNEKTFK